MTLPTSNKPTKSVLNPRRDFRSRHLLAPLMVAAVVGWGACGGEDEEQASTTSSSDGATGSGGAGSGVGGSGGALQGGAGTGGMGQGGVDPGSQEACRACAINQFTGSGPCTAKLSACKADSACTVWADCLLACTNSDYTKSCYDMCGPPADALATELKECMCSACGDVCGLACGS